MPFLDYLKELKKILARIGEEQAAAIYEAGRLVGAAVADGGVIHVFGTGHSHMIAEEAFYRAGGLAAVNPILDERLSFLEGAFESTIAEREAGYARSLIRDERIERRDVAIVISNSGRNWAPVEMAGEMIARGVPVIAITNLTQSSRAVSRHDSGKRLFELATVVIDTCAAEGDAVIHLPGLTQAVGSTSTVAGAAIINSIMIEAAAEVLRQGKDISVFPSANLEDTTEETLLELLRPYRDRIRYLGGV